MVAAFPCTAAAEQECGQIAGWMQTADQDDLESMQRGKGRREKAERRRQFFSDLLRPERAIDADGDESPDDGRPGIDVGDLPPRIEDRDEQKTGKPTHKGRRNDLGGHQHPGPRAAMRVGQVPLAARTGGHQVICGKNAVTISIASDRCERNRNTTELPDRFFAYH